MTTFELSVLFFFIGFLEFALDQYEKLVSVRLKVWPTLFYASLNHIIDFFMYVFLFSILIQFWETWHTGIHDYYKLIPYILYTLGKVSGVAAATFWYAKNKRKRDKDKSLKWLEKGRQKQKKLRELNKDISSTVEVSEEEPLFDPVETDDIKAEIKERTIESVAQKISDKIDEAFKDTSENETTKEELPEKINEEKTN